MSANSSISSTWSFIAAKIRLSVSSESPAKILRASRILRRSEPNIFLHSTSYSLRNSVPSPFLDDANLAAALPASIPQYPPITIPPPVVCFTCPAASPTTRKLGDQHLRIGPETKIDPDLVASVVALGQFAWTSSSSSLLTFPFLEASPTRTLRSPVGMLQAKNPGAFWLPKNNSTRSS